jgi:hypothetical protein
MICLPFPFLAGPDRGFSEALTTLRQSLALQLQDTSFVDGKSEETEKPREK